MTTTLLAVYPSTKGFGYVFFEEPNNLIDFGHAVATPVVNAKIIKRLERMLDFYNPDVIVIPKGSNGKRVNLLLSDIKALSKQRTKECFAYSRENIQQLFSE